MNFLVHQLMANFGKAKTSLLLETTAIRGGSELPSFGQSRNVADYMYAFAHECNSFQSLYFVQLLHYKECNVAGGKPKAGL